MQTHENSEFVMAAQQRNAGNANDPRNEKNDRDRSDRSDRGGIIFPPPATMPPGVDVSDALSDASLGLSASPGKGDHSRKRPTSARAGRPPSRTSSQRPGGPSPATSRASSRNSTVRGGPSPDRSKSPRRRARSRLTPWRDDVEATHRKIMIYPAEPIGPSFARGVALQLQADREHM